MQDKHMKIIVGLIGVLVIGTVTQFHHASPDKSATTQNSPATQNNAAAQNGTPAQNNAVATQAQKSIATTTVPQPASQAGYTTNTFSSTFDDDVDIAKTFSSGFNWYAYNYFGTGVADMKQIAVTSGKPIVLNGDIATPNSEITTAISDNKGAIIGKAFGGGAYIEATLSFDPNKSVGNTQAWPSFWSLPVEKVTYNDQWTGQALNYSHYIEFDFMEYCIGCTTVQNSYFATLHDWYGIYKTTCAEYCNIQNPGAVMAVPAGTDFTQPHQYGALWIPATESASGSIQNYFDRKPVGQKVTWKKYNAALDAPPPAGKPWLFGILDAEHIALILGTGINQPLTVYNVQVWQANTNYNIAN
jgi:hypothetical protein